MKNLVTIIEDKWTWPANDQGAWLGQIGSLNLYEQLKPHLNGRGIMIQAGGNCGLIVDTFVELFDTIYTFEPEPLNFYCLTQNVSSPKVIKMQACLGEKNQPLSIQPLKAHIVDVGGYHIDEKPGVVPMFTIDSLNLPNCDLIQLDIEGYEFKALSGAIETIKAFKPVICVEVVDEYLSRYGNTSEQLLNLLDTLDYEYIMSYGSDKLFKPKS